MHNKPEGGLQLMKSDKARKVTSREYIMKLIYQIEMNLMVKYKKY